ALLYAAENGNLKSLELLIKRGANLNITLNGGESAVLQACFRKHAAAAQMLINAGAEIGIPTEIGLTELIVAADFGDLELVKLLLSRKNNIDSVNVYG